MASLPFCWQKPEASCLIEDLILDEREVGSVTVTAIVRIEEGGSSASGEQRLFVLILYRRKG
jgi:hypothetical protein